MSKHTPGPWNLLYHDITGDKPDIYSLEEDGNIIFMKLQMRTHTMAEFDANARLIAAAPDLLDTLKDVRETIRGGDNLATLPPWCKELIATIDAAIARAEGK